MWKQIKTNEDIVCFMEEVSYFHDGCIKEIHYTSGAYVTEEHEMYPLNSKRLLRVVIQLQNPDISMVEMEFFGLVFMKLMPLDEEYTCEILDSALYLKDGLFFWGDNGDFSETGPDNYSGTSICSEGLKWRVINGFMGEANYYQERGQGDEKIDRKNL